MAISTIGTNGLDQTSNIELGATGNVGIGTASPSTKLHVAGTVLIADGAGCTLYGNSTSGNYSKIEMFNPTNGNMTLTTTYSAGNMVFATNSAERMRIDSSGNLLVGTASQIGFGKTCIAANAANYNILAIQNTNTNNAGVYCYFLNSAGNSAGLTNQTGVTTVTYATTSDYRLKENVAPMQNALGVVAKLKPVTYTWKADGSDGQGFIAHELQEVVPDCVTGQKDATRIVDELDAEGKVIGQKEEPVYQGIDTSFLVATLTAAIQELNAKVEALEAQLRNK